LTVTDVEGAPVEAVVAVDGALLPTRGEETIGGLAAGPHALVIAAHGRAAVAVDIDLGERARRRLRIVLPEAPGR
jgi:hypothetical protein